MVWCFYDVNKTYVEEVQNQVVITPSVDGYVRVSFLLTNKDIVSVNKGSTPITYVKGLSQSTTLHLGDIELNGIGNYIDLPFKDGDTWKIRRKIGKVDLSTLTFNNYNLSDGYKFYYTQEITDIKYATVNTELGNGLAEKYILHTGSGMISNSARNCIAIDVSQISLNTIDNPSGLFYYALSTPTETPITDTTLINNLNAIYELMGYDGQTNITITSASGNAQMIVEATALKGE